MTLDAGAMAAGACGGCRASTRGEPGQRRANIASRMQDRGDVRPRDRVDAVAIGPGLALVVGGQRQRAAAVAMQVVPQQTTPARTLLRGIPQVDRLAEHGGRHPVRGGRQQLHDADGAGRRHDPWLPAGLLPGDRLGEGGGRCPGHAPRRAMIRPTSARCLTSAAISGGIRHRGAWCWRPGDGDDVPAGHGDGHAGAHARGPARAAAARRG